jgi:hypothetical protein
MPSIFTFVLRVVLFAAALVAAACFAVVFVLVLGLWALRFAWARLTGRSASPFVVRFGPRDAFHGMARRATETGRAPARPARELADVTDVEPKAPGRT